MMIGDDQNGDHCNDDDIRSYNEDDNNDDIRS